MSEQERPSDPKELLALVVETITSHVTDLSGQHEQFRAIQSALDGGDELVAKVISGGCTNFSYKVDLRDGTSPLFAKLCFPYALWNPDPDVDYSLVR